MKILLIHCHYRLPGGEDAVFAAERALLEQHGGEMPVKELEEELREMGYSERTLRYAKAAVKEDSSAIYKCEGKGKEKHWKLILVQAPT